MCTGGRSSQHRAETAVWALMLLEPLEMQGIKAGWLA